MLKDPLFNSIWKRLDGSLDPLVFESCAVDLLRDAFPSITPITGGTDAGMDGAIVRIDGVPIIVVCTTSKDVSGNLRKNLKSHKDSGGKSDRAIVVTSRQLSAKQKRNLEDRASELGFVLLGTFDKEAIAQRIYHKPRWCQELLGLSGEPPALSVYPGSPRSFDSAELIGRDTEQQWIIDQISRSADSIVIGQPGSGKTALLLRLVSDNHALFVVAEDRQAIANGIRELNPKVLLVDDAHLKIDLIRDLLLIRKQTGASFTLIVDSWAGASDDLKSVMSIPNGNVKELPLLSKNQIVEVVERNGIPRSTDNDPLIGEIVRQAEGRPGLAVTLTKLCIQGGLQDVTHGDAIKRQLLSSINAATGRKEEELLAIFSLGGQRGLQVSSVAKRVGLSVLEVSKLLANLEYAGVIRDIGGHSVAVRPDAFRYTLVRDAFYQGARSLKLSDFEDLVTDKEEFCLTLIGAVARGAKVPPEELFQRVFDVGSEEVWTAYCWLGKNETERALRAVPHLASNLAHPALRRAPDTALQLIFKQAQGDDRPLHSNPDHGLRRIQDWIQSTPPRSPEVIHKREALLSGVERWLENGGSGSVLEETFPLITDLSFDISYTEPGAGRTFQLTFGNVAFEHLPAIDALFERALSVYEKHALSPSNLTKLVSNLVPYVRPGITLNTKYVPTARKIFEKRIDRIVAAAKGDDGTLHRLRQTVERKGSRAKFGPSPDFGVLYPFERPRQSKAVEEKQNKAVKQLVSKWAKRDVITICKELKRISESAARAGINYPNYSRFFVQLLAQKLSDPNDFAKALIQSDLASVYVGIALAELGLRKLPGWADVLQLALNTEKYSASAIDVVLAIENCDESLVNLVLSKLNKNHAGILEIKGLRGEIDDSVGLQILKHSDADIAGRYALGLWEGRSKRPIEGVLQSPWEDAIINFAGDKHWLLEILSADKDLGFRWVLKRLSADKTFSYEELEICKSVSSSLPKDFRQKLIKLIPADYRLDRLAARLVGIDDDIYRELLTDKSKSDLHLAPISQPASEHWAKLVIAAVQTGYSVEELADATFPNQWGWSGKESDMWQARLDNYSSMLNHPNYEVRRVCELLIERVTSLRDRSLKHERNEEVHGDD